MHLTHVWEGLCRLAAYKCTVAGKKNCEDCCPEGVCFCCCRWRAWRMAWLPRSQGRLPKAQPHQMAPGPAQVTVLLPSACSFRASGCMFGPVMQSDHCNDAPAGPGMAAAQPRSPAQGATAPNGAKPSPGASPLLPATLCLQLQSLRLHVGADDAV